VEERRDHPDHKENPGRKAKPENEGFKDYSAHRVQTGSKVFKG